MTISDALLAEVTSTVGSAITTSLSSASATSDLFEAYIFTVIIEAARTEGAAISYFDPHEHPPSQFVFRTSPGFLWSTTHPYTFALIEFSNVEPLELHLGVRVSGKSGVLHEFDVCVLPQSEGRTCRQNQVHPRASKVLAGVECKFYTTGLDLGLGRAFLGLGTDVIAKNTFFVTNTSSASIEKLLSARDRKWGHRVFPGSTVNVDRLRNDFQSVFKYFKAR